MMNSIEKRFLNELGITITKEYINNISLDDFKILAAQCDWDMLDYLRKYTTNEIKLIHLDNIYFNCG